MASSGVGALKAVRVIDFTQVLADPFCTRLPKLISERESWISGRAQCGLIGRTDLVNDAGALIALARVANRDLAGELESFTSAHTEQGLAQLSGRKTPFGPQNNVRANLACRPSAGCDRNRKRRSTDWPPRHHEKECRCP